MAPAEPWSIHERHPLAPHTTLGVGGAARWFAVASSVAEVEAAHRWCREHGVELFVLGGGSNLVIADAGIEAFVLRLAMRGLAFDGPVVIAGAGGTWDQVVLEAVKRNLAGIECLSGIPGTVGGTPIQNVGAYGQEVAETIESVTAFDRVAGELVGLTTGECGFSYRASRFKGADAGRFIVTSVRYRLRDEVALPKYPDLLAWMREEGIERPGLLEIRRAVLATRRTKGMVLGEADPDTRSVGSFFMNPVVTVDQRERIAAAAGSKPPSFTVDATHVKVPAAWLIERAGVPKGFVDGAVGTSSKHPLAIINRGGATARDVVRLATHIKRRVADQFGVALRPEPIFVGFGGDPDVTYLQRETVQDS